MNAILDLSGLLILLAAGVQDKTPEDRLREAERRLSEAEKALTETQKRLSDVEKQSPPQAKDAKSQEPKPQDPKPEVAPAKKWYDSLSLRGYTQIRHNNLPSFDRNEDLVNDQGDKYIGGGAGVAIRRARVILSGDVHPNLGIYIQPDFASSIGEQNHVAILRDLYGDIFLTQDKEFRLRVGQSKVPFGFENLQSSSNRLPFDRNDALNSAVKDERDLGVFAYWSPEPARTRFRELQNSFLKGSGDYGVVGVGVYNGQTANRFDRNDNLHTVARVSYPFELWENQMLEVWGGGYYGLYRVTLQNQGGITYTTTDDDNDLIDWRWHAGFCYYAAPFGIVGEWNAGKGPQQGEDDVSLIDSRSLRGGYIQAMVRFDDALSAAAIIPYARYQIYEGGKKFETNAPRYDVRETEVGVEVQAFKALEVTLAYAWADRTSSKFPYDQEEGQLFRIQVQFNY
jgi:hypothetical protein